MTMTLLVKFPNPKYGTVMPIFGASRDAGDSQDARDNG